MVVMRHHIPVYDPHHFHHFAPPAGVSDHWLNAVLAVGAIAGALAVIVGAVFTTRYGRRASVSVSAWALKSGDSNGVVVRPSVKAVGVFKVRFEHSVVKVAEVQAQPDGTFHVDEAHEKRNPFDTDSVFVDGGEELQTSVVVNVFGPPTPSAIAWIARFEATAYPRFPRLFPWRPVVRGVASLPLPTRWKRWLSETASRRYSWSDEVFVPLPVDEP
jgi:hypothetical protein